MMETVNIPRTPTPDIPLTWELLSPCGACGPCRHLREMTSVINDLFIARAKHVNPEHRDYYAQLDRIHAERGAAVERVGARCENLMIVAQ